MPAGFWVIFHKCLKFIFSYTSAPYRFNSIIEFLYHFVTWATHIYYINCYLNILTVRQNGVCPCVNMLHFTNSSISCAIWGNNAA